MTQYEHPILVSIFGVYLFVDTLDDGIKNAPQFRFDPEREKVIANSLRGKIFANQRPVQVSINVAGGEFFVTLPKDQLIQRNTAEVHIKVHGWLRYATFPVNKCRVSRPRSTGDMQYLIHTYTMENSHSIDDSMPSLVQAMAKHLSYHTCLLNIAVYYVNVQRQHIPYYLQNPILRTNAHAGRLVFLTKDSNRPYQVNGKSYKWQTIYANLMILQHWYHERFSNVRIFFIDVDEYIYCMKSSLDDVLQKHDVINFQRKYTICTNCNGSEYASNIQDHTYQMSHRHISTKVALNPNQAGCLLIHFSLCGNNQTSVVRLNSHISYIVHFGNTIKVRYYANEPSFKGYVADLDTMYRCLLPSNINTSYLPMAMNNIYEALVMPSDVVEDFIAVTMYDFYQTHGLTTIVGLGLVMLLAFCMLVGKVLWRTFGHFTMRNSLVGKKQSKT